MAMQKSQPDYYDIGSPRSSEHHEAGDLLVAPDIDYYQVFSSVRPPEAVLDGDTQCQSYDEHDLLSTFIDFYAQHVPADTGSSPEHSRVLARKCAMLVMKSICAQVPASLAAAGHVLTQILPAMTKELGKSSLDAK
mmetsp:Transcript_1993/g.4162  ORF Transcript_1993/g.4162 Transcript_1993/m.4162 type:complete len:136 (+) Transcript_1993:715-1122(+)